MALQAYFGGLAWRFDAADARAETQINQTCGAYQTGADATAPVVACRVASRALRSEIAPSEHIVQRSGTRATVVRADFRGDIDLVARRVDFEYRGHVTALHGFLRVANALMLADLEGLLLHASSVVRCGRAFLFPGPSGAGKTTIARLADGADVLSDEVSAVRRVDGRFFCYPTPFFGEYGCVASPVAAAPLARVCFPTKADAHALEPTTRAEAVQQILRSVYSHGADAQLTALMFDTGANLAASVRSGWLAFRPDAGFWSVIDG